MIDNRVRKYRLQNHLRQNDLALRVGTRRETVGALEMGNTIRLWNWLPELQQPCCLAADST